MVAAVDFSKKRKMPPTNRAPSRMQTRSTWRLNRRGNGKPATDSASNQSSARTWALKMTMLATVKLCASSLSSLRCASVSAAAANTTDTSNKLRSIRPGMREQMNCLKWLLQLFDMTNFHKLRDLRRWAPNRSPSTIIKIAASSPEM